MGGLCSANAAPAPKFDPVVPPSSTAGAVDSFTAHFSNEDKNSEQIMKAVFKNYDGDMNATLDTDEAYAMIRDVLVSGEFLEEAGKLDETHAKEIFTLIDTDKDGMIDRLEFKTYVKRCIYNSRSETKRGGLTANAAANKVPVAEAAIAAE